MSDYSNEIQERRKAGRPRKEVRTDLHFTAALMPPSLVVELDQEAERSGLGNRSEVIRRACMEYLRRVNRRAASARRRDHTAVQTNVI